jgi:hypothetical protein
VWLIFGRRGGKSIIAALIGVFQVACVTHTLAPGELGVFAIFATDREQAKVIRRYVGALLKSLPALAVLIESETADSIFLTNGLAIQIVTGNYRLLRGRTLVGAVGDEVAFWFTSAESANPDSEVLGAVRPAMATQPAAVLVLISSPYARRGELWKSYQRHYGRDDSDVLVLKASSREMNPELPQAIVDAAYEEDSASASAEYGAEFRRDVETFVALEVVAACVMPGRFELPARAGVKYVAFTDPSGGSSDSMTLAIAHEERRRLVVDVVREQLAPFDPDSTVREFAATLRPYRVSTVWGDRYAGEWPRERFRAHGISYRVAEHTKSELYQALLPRLNAGTIELLDHERLRKQLCALERRTSRGGRDSIDHPPKPKGRDDVVNAVAGVAQCAVRGTQPGVAAISVGEMERLQRTNGVSGRLRDELARCLDADRRREAEGTQDAFLITSDVRAFARALDDYGRPGRR